jgi:hypothetical protein
MVKRMAMTRKHMGNSLIEGGTEVALEEDFVEIAGSRIEDSGAGSEGIVVGLEAAIEVDLEADSEAAGAVSEEVIEAASEVGAVSVGLEINEWV